MKTKIAVVVTGILLLMFVGCREKPKEMEEHSASSAISQEDMERFEEEISSLPEEAPPASQELPAVPPIKEGPQSGEGRGTEEISRNMKVEIVPNQRIYAKDDKIILTITITNVGNTTVGYVIGSSSNPLPSALQLEAGGLVPLNLPLMMTDDYGLQILEPGKQETFTAEYAPYTGPWTGKQTTVAQFAQDPNYQPVPAGTMNIKATLVWSDFGETFQADQEDAFMFYDTQPEQKSEQTIPLEFTGK